GVFRHISQPELTCEYFYEHDNLNDFVTATPAIRGIIAHSISALTASAISKLQQRIKIYWIVWGYDIYQMPRIQPGLYAPQTYSYLAKEKPRLSLLWTIKKHKPLRFLFYNARGKKNVLNLLEATQKEVDYFVTYIREDYELFKEKYPDTKCKFFNAAFFDLNQYVGNAFMDKRIAGKNILIGNSNSVECNHLDVIQFFKKVPLESETKVYIPLSYGEGGNYKEAVTKSADQVWGPRSFPLLGFMPLQEYVEILLTCGVGIFYHYRQQAMGNIIAMLWLGARIYMAGVNPAFQFFKRIGVHVFDLNQDFQNYGLSPLTEKEISTNRAILTEAFSAEKVAQDYANLVRNIYE
ncbi:TDP-N-acetylfucosamine:lipid II N-acetylfucosaminyltransferase, partial [Dyadobacter sp.]|uniref:TDP-N-acetylfucosamine:lipid II N-acetylfucosaminyltransferase n=1 Tax=Dyadobacter sp. TaxID=1914288 RepID=UPI003F72DE93